MAKYTMFYGNYGVEVDSYEEGEQILINVFGVIDADRIYLEKN